MKRFFCFIGIHFWSESYAAETRCCRWCGKVQFMDWRYPECYVWRDAGK